MDFDWLPKELTIRCDALVAAHHRAYGGSLPKILWHRNTMVFITTHSELLTLLSSASAAYKFMLVAGGTAVVAMIAAALVNWWIVLAAVPLAYAATRFKKHGSQCYRLVAAVILAIEMLADDFAGWGSHFPALMQRARETLENDLPFARTRLLDIYLPRRSALDQATLGQFGPPA